MPVGAGNSNTQTDQKRLEENPIVYDAQPKKFPPYVDQRQAEEECKQELYKRQAGQYVGIAGIAAGLIVGIYYWWSGKSKDSDQEG